jgi:hypothetical protein
MKQESNPIDTFYREAPAVAKAFDGLVEALKDTKGLDSKTKQLVYIGIKVSLVILLLFTSMCPWLKRQVLQGKKLKTPF